jgi:hypothetical protein
MQDNIAVYSKMKIKINSSTKIELIMVNKINDASNIKIINELFIYINKKNAILTVNIIKLYIILFRLLFHFFC